MVPRVGSREGGPRCVASWWLAQPSRGIWGGMSLLTREKVSPPSSRLSSKEGTALVESSYRGREVKGVRG